MTAGRALRLPTPPTMRNHGHYVASLCEIVRWLGEKAEGLGVNMFTGFPAESLLVEERRVRGVRTTPSGLKRDGQPGSGLHAAHRHQGQGHRARGRHARLAHPGLAALAEGGLRQPDDLRARGEGALGDEAAARRRDPHPGLAAAARRLRRKLLLSAGAEPGGPRPRGRPRLPRDDARRPRPAAEDEAASALPALPGGRGDGGVGSEDDPRGRLLRAARSGATATGSCSSGDAGGFVEVASLKGIHYAILSGMYAARAIFAALKARRHVGGGAGRLRPAGGRERDRERPARAAEHAARVPEGRLLPGRHRGRAHDA